MTASQPKHTPDGSPGTGYGRHVAGNYRVYDIPICSQIPLPELPVCRENEPLVTVRLVESGPVDQAGFVSRHEWRDDTGRLLCRCALREGEYRLSLPQQASFYLQPTGVIRCAPAPGLAPALLRQLLLNQVLPRYLAHTGELLLHASAVTLPNGKTVAFLGESGQGKSTLAAYCQQHGAQIIDDDCILMRPGGQRVSITGGVPTIRLYPDSLRALGHNPADFVPCVEGSDKRQLCLAGGATPGSEPRLLDALFLLGAVPDTGAEGTVRILPVAGQAAMMAMLGSAFNLDPSDPDTMARTFRRAGQALAAGLTVHQLRYPREHAVLPQVMQALSQHWHG